MVLAFFYYFHFFLTHHNPSLSTNRVLTLHQYQQSFVNGSQNGPSLTVQSPCVDFNYTNYLAPPFHQMQYQSCLNLQTCYLATHGHIFIPHLHKIDVGAITVSFV